MTMPHRRLGAQDFERFRISTTKAPRCPLCHQDMKRQWEPRFGGFHIWRCDGKPGLKFLCRIAIRCDDPFVFPKPRWDEAYHNATAGAGILCPMGSCETKMRYFATSAGYMKAACPKCGVSMDNAVKDDRKPGDGVVLGTPETPGTLH